MARQEFTPNQKPVPSALLRRLTITFCDTVADRDAILAGERWNGRLVFVATDETYYQWSDPEGGWVTLIGLSKPVASAAARPAARIGSRVFRLDLGYEEVSLNGTDWVPAGMHVVITDVSVVANPRTGMTATETTKLFRKMLWDGVNWKCDPKETVRFTTATKPTVGESSEGLNGFNETTSVAERFFDGAWQTQGWTSYNPVVTLGAGFSLGNAVITARWRRVASKRIEIDFRFKSGTTTVHGAAGRFDVSLPLAVFVDASLSYLQGAAGMHNPSTANYGHSGVSVHLYSASAQIYTSDGSLIAFNLFTNSGQLSFFASYEEA